MRQIIFAAGWLIGVGGFVYALYHTHRARQAYWKRDAERGRHVGKALGGMAVGASAFLGVFAYFMGAGW